MKYTFTTLVALALGLSLCTSCNKENTEPINKKVEKKEEAKPLDIFIEDVKLYVGDSQLIKINNGDTSKFTFNFEDATIARAEVATEEISGVQIKRIKVTGLKAGATTFTVSDGKITTKPINVKVKSIDPITILGAKDGSLVAIKEYSLKLEENYNFTIRGGREEFELEYDKELLVVGDVKDNGEDFIVNVAVNPEVAVAQDAKLVVKQKENPENKAELTIHIVVPVNEYSLQFQKGGASYEPDRDSDGDPVIKLKVGEVLTIQQVGW